MNLIEHYDNLYRASVQKILTDEYQSDDLINSLDDKRRGITLIIRPDLQVRNRIQQFIDDLKTIEPRQYYYPNSDIHITLMSVISCYNGFDLSQISIADYVEVIQKCITRKKRFQIEFRGITASSSCVMVQGFPGDDSLNDIRDGLRTAFKNSDLQQTIDKRYSIQTAHSTVVRFRRKFSRKEAFIKIVDRYREYDFGQFTVNNIELVYNDWYQRRAYVETLFKFDFK